MRDLNAHNNLCGSVFKRVEYVEFKNILKRYVKIKHMIKTEQVSSSLSLIQDYDNKYIKKEDFVSVFESALGEGSITTETYNNRCTVYVYKHDGKEDHFLTANVVYLGNPHPHFKKRIELKKWYREYYSEHKNDSNITIRLIGLYTYDAINVFVNFKIDSYLGNEFNNSAAHVYTNDIFQALKYGTFQKEDASGNLITTIRRDKFKEYLEGDCSCENKLFNLFDRFNCGFPFGKWITAVKAICEMRDKDFSKWRETEWQGWFLELRFWEFTDQEKCKELMKYSRDFTDLEKEFDFDIYFKEFDFYGDLKTSSVDEVEVCLNAQDSVIPCLMKYEKMWYVVYEHLTEKDLEYNSEMAKERMALIGKPYIEGGQISYQRRMKHSVNFQRMKIIELNRINYHEALSEFNQGRQPNGSSRKPKFKINKKNIENFIVYSYNGVQK